MRGPALPPIVIAAGGTGGHFFPAEALAAELIRRGRRVALITDARSAGQSSPVFEGRERFVIAGSGIAGRGFSRGVRAMGSLAFGTLQARKILAGLRPGVVVGFGGYPCVAPVLASRLLPHRPKILLHEQNAVLGRANRLLSRVADVLVLGVPGTVAGGEVTGNPVRPAIAALAGQGYSPPSGAIRLLVLGGSLGARVFSDVVPAAISALPQALRARIMVTQQCRPEDLSRVRDAYAAAGIACDLASFFADVPVKLTAAHLVIARAGASTVAELAAAGRPAILVPLPGAIDDHQTANAQALTTTGAAWLMPQSRFTPDSLAEKLGDLLTSAATLSLAAAAAAGLAKTDAAARLADIVAENMPEERPGALPLDPHHG